MLGLNVGADDYITVSYTHLLLHFLLRDVVRPQAHGEKQPQLLFQRQLLVAGVRHVAAHDAGRADLHIVKVPLRGVGQIAAKNAVQLLRRLPENVFGGFLLRVGFDVDFPEIFVQLRQRYLDGRLHRVNVDRRQLCPRLIPRHGELVGEHEFHQLRQDAVPVSYTHLVNPPF